MSIIIPVSKSELYSIIKDAVRDAIREEKANRSTVSDEKMKEVVKKNRTPKE